MPIYETVCILHPELSEARVKEVVQGMQKTLEAGEAKLLEIEEWGMRNLAYEVRKQTRGYYVRLEYESRPQAVTEFERGLRLSEDTLRFLSVARAAPSNGKSPVPAASPGGRAMVRPATPPPDTPAAAAPPASADAPAESPPEAAAAPAAETAETHSEAEQKTSD